MPIIGIFKLGFMLIKPILSTKYLYIYVKREKEKIKI